MASLSVRKLDDNVYRQLQARAVAHGVSMEEEVRGIILQAVLPPRKLSAVFREQFGEENGVDLTLPKRDEYEPVSFK